MPEEQPTPVDVSALSPRRALLPLAGGLGALALGGLGEVLVESHNTTILSLLLYLAGIGLFAWSATLLPSAPRDLPSKNYPPERPRRRERLPWVVLGVGVVTALAQNVAAFLTLREDLNSEQGLWLWLASLAVIAATGIAMHRLHNWPARWLGGAWPSSTWGRRWIIISIAVISVAAVAARFWSLDKIPLGINADEGDRAATAIQVVHGTLTESVFGDGWYQISMVYFTLLAGLFKLIGIGFVQARVFGVVASLITLVIIIWIGARHFSWRVALMAGGIFALMGIALQFARETSESGPTATLWALSMALFLEAARTGRMWAWVGAGLAGGFSIYFYPTGRLWPALAAIVCLYLLIHGLKGKRASILRGSVVAALAAIMIMMPFGTNILRKPENFISRARETSIFTQNNPTRLHYYNPEWSTPQLVVEQTIRGVGAFNQFIDDGGFWPTDAPMMSGLLALLTLMGLGWVCLRLRDPRYAILAFWFWLGLVGVIVTVETPNFQRMGTAIPTLAFFPALILDSLIRRIQLAVERLKPNWAQSVSAGATALAALVVVGIGLSQVVFYFNDYGKRDRYPQPTTQGRAVSDQGADTLTLTVGGSFHMVNSGWIQLLAPETPRGGMRYPGRDLPLAMPAKTNLAFMIYPSQKYYLPYLRTLYPFGVAQEYTHPSEGVVVTIYRIARDQWASMQGAAASIEGGGSALVPTLGAIPPGITGYPARVTWTAGLRVPAYWNYSFRIGPGPARLSIDGVEALVIPPDKRTMEATVSLAAGDHVVRYQGTIEGPGRPALFEWAQNAVPYSDGTSPPPEWRVVRTEELISAQTQPRGLYGVVQIEGRPEQYLLSNTIAQCCLAGEIQNNNRPYSVTWTGSLDAPTTGTYSMTLTMQGKGHLLIDGNEVIHRDEPSEEPFAGSVALEAGKHTVELRMEARDTRGDIEWRWIPPGGQDSIVPPSVLSPPESVVLSGQPIDLATFRDIPVALHHEPIETVR